MTIKNIIQTGYNQDFYAWAMHNSELLREKKLSEIDIENIAEEIESMGKRERRNLINRLAILIAHLLKWQFQPDRRGKSWKCTIKEQRIKIRNLLKDSPSLKHELGLKLNHAYEIAIVDAEKESCLEELVFPKTCEFSFEQCLDPDFWPEN